MPSLFFNKKNNKDFITNKSTLVKKKDLNSQIARPKISSLINFLRFSLDKKIDVFKPDKSRVITKFYRHESEEKARSIIERILALTEDEVQNVLAEVYRDFSKRHRNVNDIFRRNFMEVSHLIGQNFTISDERKLLIGSYFTMEYSIESTALFNPSLVIYPKQNDLRPGQTRVLISFRATGEGHLSSIVFRSLVIDKLNNIFVEPISKYVGTPEMILNAKYNKGLIAKKMEDIGHSNEILLGILSRLNEEFTMEEALSSIKLECENKVYHENDIKLVASKLVWLLKSNYEIIFSPLHLISERVIFPISPTEINGVEDARFVRFVDDDGQVTYYATYTAYDGLSIMPQLIETKDFHHFKMRTLNGPYAKNKGMALFPRKINGRYAMIGRSDGENLFLLYSDNLDFWYEGKKIITPTFDWELVQIGNCGSPIETEKGWILLTHGVGPMRRYCIGAILLDLEDPSKIIGRLKTPLITPDEKERDGYVPNVVYSCGSIILNDQLIIPYATSDSISHIAIISAKELLNKLLGN